ncbi:TadE/TadG family type IV pilus assembly protein [Maritimibacter sp. HL-12]|jgi:hypothetical protein|uniref:TadE/TadG family type IV pilus assembly protein n=1 Tax=Maritimibacter sp. HL-12 TaxID=1162418 RepID=UPI000A0F2A92|nr:hypothetical protein [Maritimibacter sp. HL-12]SMH54914.1 hypothetical protein SAMN05661107_2997 [Maritimibacter sp. HL-12]
MSRATASVNHALRRASRAIGRFAIREDASLSVEAVVVLPILLWGFLAIFVFFDAFRVKNLALKANYAISDLLSRETSVIDMDYIRGSEQLYEFLTRVQTDAWLRVTVVHCTDNCADADRTLEVDWSRGTDEVLNLTSEDIMDDYEPIVPWIPNGERVIMVESSLHYEPPFSQAITGLAARSLTNVVLTRPRFAPQLCFEGVGCGS